MEQTITRYFCDNCNKEMNQSEYQEGTKLTIKVDIPNPKGGCGQCSGVVMALCEECSENVGIVNSKEYHDYIYSQSRLTDTIEKIKTKVVDMFSKKIKG